LAFTADDFKSKLNFTNVEIERMNRLIDRGGSIAFEIQRYADMGINIMTRADTFYPILLKNKLGKSCPPIFYFAGNPNLTKKRCIGFVGSRNVVLDDEDFTVKTVEKCNSKDFSVVSGGAKGIDSVAQTTSIKNGNICIEFISDSLIRKIKAKNNINAILNDQLLILSVTKPDAGFSTGIAMMRNKYIYSQSDGTVIIKSDLNKGGTWSGAIENLKKQMSMTFCWNNTGYKGNMELISRGAIPIDENWDAEILSYASSNELIVTSEQLSMFAV